MSDSIIARYGLFRVDWASLNRPAGNKFAIAIVIAVLLTSFTEFDFITILIAAFLAWMTDVPGPTANRVLGMLIFGLTGVAMIWMAAAVFTNALWFSAAMFGIAFVFTLPMAVSQRGYMIGWVTILWFFSVAPLTVSGNLAAISIDVLIGVGLVVMLTLLWPRGVGPWGGSNDATSAETGGVDDHVFVLVYALTVATVMAAGIYIGVNWLTAGAVWVANGAFFVLGPSTRQSWVHGIERAIAVVIGITLGLILVTAVANTTVLLALMTAAAFSALAALNAGYVLSIGAYTAGMTIGWSALGHDVSHVNAPERILAEAIAITLAVCATAFLQWWSNHRRIDTYVEARLAAD